MSENIRGEKAKKVIAHTINIIVNIE